MASKPSTATSDEIPNLKLFGEWASSTTHRVQIALKLKGLEFEYAQEDPANKSPALLQLNPVYKRVPVLVHDGNPVSDSVVILQYVDETWAAGRHPLLPRDPYERALARFWCHFSEDKLAASVAVVFQSTGDERKAGIERVRENFGLIESELRDGCFKGRRFFGGEELGMLDIVIGAGCSWLWVFEEIIGVKLVDPESFPLFHSWLREFERQEAVKETFPPHDQLLQAAMALRQMEVSFLP